MWAVSKKNEPICVLKLVILSELCFYKNQEFVNSTDLDYGRNPPLQENSLVTVGFGHNARGFEASRINFTHVCFIFFGCRMSRYEMKLELETRSSSIIATVDVLLTYINY
jgi:hypothetical protein